MRRFEQHDGAWLQRQLVDDRGALGRLGGQKAREQKALRIGRDDARHADGRGHAARARQRNRAQTGGLHGGAKARARVAHARRACIAHIDNPFALLQQVDHLRRALGLVVLVHGEQLAAGLVESVGAQHLLGVARVFAGDMVGQLQHMQGAQGDICKIADRGRHDVQGPLRIMLSTGCFLGSCQGRGKRCAHGIS